MVAMGDGGEFKVKGSWKLNPYEKRLIARRYASGESIRSIAGSFQIANWIVGYYARIHGVPRRSRRRRENISI
jgi:hypothetical protein